MGASKLKPVHVAIIGAVVAIIVGAGLYFLMISPASADVAKLKSTDDGLKNDIQQNLTAPKKKEAAEALLAAAKGAWQARVSQLTSPPPYRIPTGPDDEKEKMMPE